MTRPIVFSAAWDDRCADLRADQAALDGLLARADTGVMPIWRGRPLIAGDARGHIAWLPANHPIFADAAPDWVFLGKHDGRARFVADVSSWSPESVDDAAMLAFLDPSEYTHPSVPDDHVFVELRGLLTRLDPVDAAMASTARALLNWHRTHGFCSACGKPSVIAQAGWQRRCDSCGANHFPRTDPVVIMLILNGNRALLGRSPGWPAGMFSALAGFVEPGETPESAVIREVFEETGIKVHNTKYIGAQPWAFPNSLMLGFTGEALSDQITLDAELDDALWITREDMVQVMAGTHPVVKKPRPGAIAHDLVSRWLAGTI